jgi:hypothetical protein
MEVKDNLHSSSDVQEVMSSTIHILPDREEVTHNPSVEIS